VILTKKRRLGKLERKGEPMEKLNLGPNHQRTGRDRRDSKRGSQEREKEENGLGYTRSTIK